MISISKLHQLFNILISSDIQSTPSIPDLINIYKYDIDFLIDMLKTYHDDDVRHTTNSKLLVKYNKERCTDVILKEKILAIFNILSNNSDKFLKYIDKEIFYMDIFPEGKSWLSFKFNASDLIPFRFIDMRLDESDTKINEAFSYRDPKKDFLPEVCNMFEIQSPSLNDICEYLLSNRRNNSSKISHYKKLSKYFGKDNVNHTPVDSVNSEFALLVNVSLKMFKDIIDNGGSILGGNYIESGNRQELYFEFELGDIKKRLTILGLSRSKNNKLAVWYSFELSEIGKTFPAEPVGNVHTNDMKTLYIEFLKAVNGTES